TYQADGLYHELGEHARGRRGQYQPEPQYRVRRFMDLSVHSRERSNEKSVWSVLYPLCESLCALAGSHFGQQQLAEEPNADRESGSYFFLNVSDHVSGGLQMNQAKDPENPARVLNLV